MEKRASVVKLICDPFQELKASQKEVAFGKEGAFEVEDPLEGANEKGASAVGACGVAEQRKHLRTLGVWEVAFDEEQMEAPEAFGAAGFDAPVACRGNEEGACEEKGIWEAVVSAISHLPLRCQKLFPF